MKLFLNAFVLSLFINLCLGLSDSKLMKTDSIENLTDFNRSAVVIGESDVQLNTTEQTTTIQATSTTVLDTSTTGITSTESISTTTTTPTSQSSTSTTTTASNTTANLADVIPTRYAQAAETNLTLSDLAQNISDTLTSAFGEHTDRLFTIDSETANEKYASKYTPCQVYSNGLLCRLFYPYIFKKLNQNVDQTTTRKPSALSGIVTYYNPNTGVLTNNNNNYGLSNTGDYSSLLASLFGQGYDNSYNSYPYNYAINNNNNINGISNNNNLFGYYNGYNDNTNYYANYNRRHHHKYLNRFGADVY